MVHLFENKTANEAWHVAATKFRESGAPHIQGGRGGLTRELLHSVFSIEDPRQRWVPSRSPAMNPAFALAEVVWILNGRNDSALINYWNPKLCHYSGNEAKYHGAYGFRLRHHFNLDQLDRAYRALRENPDSRQVVLQIWDPIVDLPHETGEPQAADIPCNICSILKLRNNKLEWLQVMRSNDLFRGLPYNFVQFTCLQEILAGWLGAELGHYIQVSDSLHIYESDASRILDFDFVEGKSNDDNLSVEKGLSDYVLSELSFRMNALMDSEINQEEFDRLTALSAVPQAFQNMLLIIAADGARRRGWNEFAVTLLGRCTNHALTQMCERWFKRCLSRN
jgi:thymidylate synthase